MAALDKRRSGSMNRYPKVFTAVLAVVAFVGSSLGGVAAARPVQQTSASAAACSEQGAVVDRGRGWTSIAAPEFPPGSLFRFARNTIYDANPAIPFNTAPAITGFAVDPDDPNLIFVTDGFSIMRTLDRGCSWDVVFRPAELLPVDSPDGTWLADMGGSGPITQIEIPQTNHSAQGSGVYALVFASGNKTWVVRGNDKGDPDSWVLQSEMVLNEASSNPILEFSPQDPSVGYLVYREGSAGFGGSPAVVTYRTTDGGITWELRSGDTSTPCSLVTPCSALTMHPRRVIADAVDTETLWLLDARGGTSDPQTTGNWAVSTDGGSTWESNDTNEFAIFDVAVSELKGQPAAFGIAGDSTVSGDGYAALSRDHGQSWARWATSPTGSGGFGVNQRLIFGRTTHSAIFLNMNRSPGMMAPKVWRLESRALRSRRPPWADVTPVGLPTTSSSAVDATIFGPTAVSFDGSNTVFSLLVTPNSRDDHVIWQLVGR